MDKETLNTIITVITTGFVTLFAVYLTNRANYKKLILQTDLEREFKTKEITRGKLEELYLLTEIWLNANFTHWLPFHGVMLGELTYNDALEIAIKHTEKNKYEFNRIKMLINLYFPSVLKEYDELINVQDRINRIIYEHKKDYKKGNFNGLKYAEPFRKEQNIFSEKSKNLIQSIINLQNSL